MTVAIHQRGVATQRDRSENWPNYAENYEPRDRIGDVRSWPKASIASKQRGVSDWVYSGPIADIAKTTLLTQSGPQTPSCDGSAHLPNSQVESKLTYINVRETFSCAS